MANNQSQQRLMSILDQVKELSLQLFERDKIIEELKKENARLQEANSIKENILNNISSAISEIETALSENRE